jgi:septal ring factor EnvC (AmiA/AmiB activator)
MSKLKKLFNRNKQETPVTLPAQQTMPIPRSKEEINTQYTQVCTQLGHNQVNQILLQKEAEKLQRYIESFANEMQAREALDAKTAEEQKQKSSGDSLAPETTGVDASV